MTSSSLEKPKVLVADDELSLREVLSIFLEQEGFEVHIAVNADEACQSISQIDFSLVLSDLRMPRGGGMKVLEYLQKQKHDALIIMMTAYASPETAVEAMKLGAHDYLVKPFQLESLRVTINRALDHYRLKQENRRLKEAIKGRERFEGLIGRSASMRHIFTLIERVAPAKTPILIMGESGTGKEMVAQAIHKQSNRALGPFVALNCAALPEHLLESTLFGHRKGSFTGAVEHRQGLFQAAHQGTLFLDEIGEMPLAMQAKVLRALQEQKVMAVGSLEEEEINLRIVAATNRPLLEDVNAGRFREDLYYRLNVIPIHLPPLRERPSDIALLTEHFIAYYAKEYSKVVKRVNPMVMEALTKSIFPGNVRELKNLVERAVTLATSEELSAKDFLWESTANFVMRSSSLVEKNAERITGDVSSENSTQSLSKNRDLMNASKSIEMTENLSALALFIQEQDDEKESQQSKDAWDIEICLEKVETGLIKEALDRCSGNRTETAKYLGLSFRSLRYRLKKLGIDD